MLVRLANLDCSFDQLAIVELLDMYARDPMGEGTPLSDDVRARLLPGLKQQPGCRVFLALSNDEPVGLAICFLGFSSFRALPLMNVHDLAVAPARRGSGIGKALLQAIEEEARQRGCCRLTLEVRADNHQARELYRRFGFEAGESVTDNMSFWKKPIG